MKKLIILFFLAMCFSSKVTCWSFFGARTETPTPVIEITRFTLMLDPAGDDRNAGREIHDMFERGIAMQCAQEVKKSLEARSAGTRVVLTRFPGEIVEPLQNAAFANRLNVDLYISLHFYHTKEKKPQLYFYHSLYNPGTDFWGKKGNELALLPYDQAYKLSIKKTDSVIKSLYNDLKEDKSFACHKPLGIPLKQLAGVIPPALSLEFGLSHSDDWKKIVPLLVVALEKLIEDTRTNDAA